MILAIDIGTTFLKVAIIDSKGIILFYEKRAIELSQDINSGEIEPNKWIEGLMFLSGSVPKELLKKIKSIVVSGNGPTFIPVDDKYNTLGNALLWADKRALTVGDEIQDRLGEFLPPNFFLSKAYWFKKNKEDLYNSTKHFLSCPEYISFLLTGEVFTLLPEKGFVDYYWNNSKIDKLGLDSDKFPDFISPFEAYGKLNNTEFFKGIDLGVPVICAGPDFTMSILGTGSVTEGVICDRTGTSEGINFCSSKNLKIDGFRTLPHIATGLWTVAGLIPNSGDYLLSDRLNKLIDEYKNIINKMIESGLEIKEIRVIGGHAGIDKINKLKASCFPFPLKIYPDGSELIGNAVLGNVIDGTYKNLEDACQVMVKDKFCFNI